MKAKEININVAIGVYAGLEDIIRYFIQENHGTQDSERFVQDALTSIDGKIMNAIFDEQERIKAGFRSII